MIGGVSFQPQDPMAGKTARTPAQTGVQEAIQILSLRLPKTMGARALAPGALLNAQGSGGNPRVDSVVNQVMSRMFPTGGAPGGAPGGLPPIPGSPPVLGQPSPTTSGTMPVSPPVRYDGNVQPNVIPPTTRLQDLPPPRTGTPNIRFETPTPPGTMMPNEWPTPPPGPPPGFDDNFPRYDGPLQGAPEPMSLEELFAMFQPPRPETFQI